MRNKAIPALCIALCLALTGVAQADLFDDVRNAPREEGGETTRQYIVGAYAVSVPAQWFQAENPAPQALSFFQMEGVQMAYEVQVTVQTISVARNDLGDAELLAVVKPLLGLPDAVIETLGERPAVLYQGEGAEGSIALVAMVEGPNLIVLTGEITQGGNKQDMFQRLQEVGASLVLAGEAGPDAVFPPKQTATPQEDGLWLVTRDPSLPTPPDQPPSTPEPNVEPTPAPPQ